MNATLRDLSTRIEKLEEEIEAELQRRRADLHADFEGRKIRFEREVEAAQRRLRRGVIGYIRDATALTLLTAPLIYAAIVPMVLLELFLMLYQAVCFPVYGIKKVRRRDYFVFDRGHLAYLNIIEKVNCAYCSYANGFAAYFTEIAARTEQYWCPIKHARRLLHAHAYYHNFTDFGDAQAYRDELVELRKLLRRAGTKAK